MGACQAKPEEKTGTKQLRKQATVTSGPEKTGRNIKSKSERDIEVNLVKGIHPVSYLSATTTTPDNVRLHRQAMLSKRISGSSGEIPGNSHAGHR